MGWLISIWLACDALAGGIDSSPESRHTFWAYQPVRKVSAPSTLDTHWPTSEIDRFILARLERSGIRPAKDADRETLIRRLYFDLVGLPPTSVEIDEFLNDRSPEAINKIVDRLLDSPHYGERWGRHWLDVARYADSSGGGRSLIFPNAWRYRDYVIESINRDKPFDQFIREQIAGDLLSSRDDGERAERLIATTFLMIGAHNYELQDKEQLRMDVVDEQIEAVGRSLLGQTLSCARCHDHKFDPIPTTDYYALAGIFRSTKSLTPGNVSGFEQHELPVAADHRAALDAHATVTKTVQTQLDAAKAELKKVQDSIKVARGNAAGQKKSLLGVIVDDVQAIVVGSWTKSKYTPGYVGDGYIHDDASGKGEKSVTFHVDFPHDGLYEVRLSYTHGTNRSPSVPVTIHHVDDQETVQIDERQPPPLDGQFIALGRWQFQKGASNAVVISNESTTGHVIVDAVQFIPAELLDATSRRIPTATDRTEADKSPAVDSDSQSQSAQFKVQGLESQVKQLEGELKKLKDHAPPPAPLTMGVKDEKEVGDFRVCIRGVVHNLGEDVRRGFVAVASGSATTIAAVNDSALQNRASTTDAGDVPAIATGESGRRELADWLTARSNPLTVRVTVNRIWHHLFGSGIVRTTDNFGSTGELPSHPELLDWLALRFIELGWSQKKLIRELVLSHAYQMSSEPERASPPLPASASRQAAETAEEISDPSNRLLARQNRKRLDAECLRDAILSMSGQLDLTPGGPAMRDKTDSEYGYKFDSNRRSIYSPIFRNNLPDILDVFDFANPNTPTGQREVSTLPSQALYLMNSPFVMDAARHAAQAVLELDLADSDRVALSYRRTLGRRPTDTERRLAITYIHDFKSDRVTDPAAQRLEAWSRLYQALIASVDFRYLH